MKFAEVSNGATRFRAPRSSVVLAVLLMLVTASSCARKKKKHFDPVPEAPEEFTVTESGLKYRILIPSEGQKPSPDDHITVHYKGWLDDGEEFANSYRRRSPATFSMGNVIAGLREGMLLIGEGGSIELEIPSELGYRERGHPPKIPPNATLHFEISLIEVH